MAVVINEEVIATDLFSHWHKPLWMKLDPSLLGKSWSAKPPKISSSLGNWRPFTFHQLRDVNGHGFVTGMWPYVPAVNRSLFCCHGFVIARTCSRPLWLFHDLHYRTILFIDSTLRWRSYSDRGLRNENNIVLSTWRNTVAMKVGRTQV